MSSMNEKKSKAGNIFQQSLWRLTLFYMALAVILTVSFSIPPYFAQQQARQQIERQVETQELSLSASGEIHQLLIARSQDSTDSFNQTLVWLEVIMLIITTILSYFLARHTLQPLKEVLDRQETFAGEISHELRTPMARALMEIESLKRSEKNMPAVYTQAFDSVAEELKSVSKMAGDILELLATEHAGDGLFTDQVDLSVLAQETVEEMQSIAKAKQISLAVHDSPALTIPGNRGQLKQLITILIDNAIKYTPEKGGVTVDLQPEGKEVELSVRDTGLGIPKADQARIFERFTQLNPQQSQGSGLGLAIAKRITELHRGTIKVISTPKKGSTFVVRLPITK